MKTPEFPERIPVIIAARNEEDYIGRTLAALDSRTVDPYVITNDSHDRTADIARSMGAHVYELDEPGKLPALQRGLINLGEKALGPVLYTDADTYPLNSAKWAGAMTKALSPEHPVVSGLLVAAEGNLVVRTAVSALRIANVAERVALHEPHACGGNMATLLGDEAKLWEVLMLDKMWPKDDLAIADAIEGHQPHRVVLNPDGWVVTSSRYIPSLGDLVKNGVKGARVLTDQNRAARAVVGAIAYQPE